MRGGRNPALRRRDPCTEPHAAGPPEDDPRADIEYGAQLYAQHCFGCHGGSGDGVAGVDLRSGKFRNAATDPQLRTVITNGIPNAGMPAFNLDTAELTGVIAYLRNMNTFDAGSVRAGDAVRGQTVFEGKGACLSCHRVNNTGSRKAPDLKSKEIFAVVPDSRKAVAVRDCVEGRVSPMAPASILQTHPNTTLYLDEDSAALLKPSR